MPATAPQVAKLQIWAHRAEPAREFLVLAVSGDQVRGWDYWTTSSATRTCTLDRSILVGDYTLREDVPGHLRAVPRG